MMPGFYFAPPFPICSATHATASVFPAWAPPLLAMAWLSAAGIGWAARNRLSAGDATALIGAVGLAMSCAMILHCAAGQAMSMAWYMCPWMVSAVIGAGLIRAGLMVQDQSITTKNGFAGKCLALVFR